MTIKFFKIISSLEGISLLLLYFFAMPMKYLYGEPIYVKHIGMIHGMLFVMYIFSALFLWNSKVVNFKKFIIFSLLSLVPFGFYVLEKKYIKTLKQYDY